MIYIQYYITGLTLFNKSIIISKEYFDDDGKVKKAREIELIFVILHEFCHLFRLIYISHGSCLKGTPEQLKGFDKKSSEIGEYFSIELIGTEVN